jgi:hypothetical protein
MNPEIRCEEVIIINLTSRGSGVKHSPIRTIVQVYTKQGELIAENDPLPEMFSMIDMVHFAEWCRKGDQPAVPVNEHFIFDWLESIKDR